MLDRRDELRSGVRLRRRVRRHHRERLRRDARLRLPRAAGEARAARARGHAGRRGQRRAAYLCRVRKGIYFTPDPAFRGQPRELTAADFAYGFKRVLDPAVKSPWLWMIDGKLVGARRSARAADEDRPLRLRRADRGARGRRPLHAAHPPDAPDLRFPYVLAVPNMAAQAREVVEAYGSDIGAHPVGTGPFLLGDYRRSNRIVLEANPGLSRDDLRAGRADPRGVAARGRGAEGRSACRWSAASRSASSRRARRAGSLPAAASSTSSTSCRSSSRARRSTTPATSSPRSPRRASCTTCCCDRTRGGSISTWRTRSSAATRRSASRCAARSAWATTTPPAIRVLLEGPRGARARADPARTSRATIRR